MLIGRISKNKVINGRFDYWQRNTSFTSPVSGTYTADRFSVAFDGTIGTYTISRQAFTLGQVEVPGNPKYFYRWAHTVAGSGSTYRLISHKIESVETFAGKKCTIAFWAKGDALRSQDVRLVQKFGTGGSPSSDVILTSQQIALTTAWKRFDLTFDVPSVSGKTLGTAINDNLEIQMFMPLNATFTFDLTNVMAVEGEVASDFELAGGDLPGELRMCQRYGVPCEGLISGGASRSSYFWDYPLSTPLRSTPVITGSGTWSIDGGAYNSFTPTFQAWSKASVSMYMSGGGVDQDVLISPSGIFLSAEF